ncbi:MAG: CPBP family intramembrane metalloprotease [Verrucomicrobia bacterium]|nr:CPBP family intramembrane metalloprotease [Verrucomicrobiota bacterium]
MSIERPWKIEAVLMLCAGVIMCLSAGTFAVLAVKAALPNLTPDQHRFAGFLISAASFQIAGLFLVHRFVKAHELTWGEFLGLTEGDLKRTFQLAIAVAIVALPIALGLNELSRVVITQSSGDAAMQPTMQALEATQGPLQRAVFAFTAIVLAPLIEEILFRGILYRTGQQLGFPRLALFGSSIVFAAIHASLMTLVPLTVLAIIFARLYDHTNRLIAPIVAHSLFNAVNFVAYINRDALTRWVDSVK